MLYGKIDQQSLAQFGDLEFIAKQVVEGFITGMHRSPFHGFSVEFAEHRLYNTGESTKHIDWKLYGKTDKLFVKRYEEETNLRCRMLLDISSSMYFPEISKNQPLNKLGFSIYAIASLIALLKKQRDGVGLTAFDNDIKLNTAIKTSQAHHKYLYHELEKLMTEQKNSLSRKTMLKEMLHEVAENNHRRSLVLIFSDFFSSEKLDDLTEAFLHLRHNKHEVILFHIVDENLELKLEFPNKPTTFVDLETGQKIKLQPNEIRSTYSEKVQEQKKALEMKCRQFGIDFIASDINQGFQFILQQYLIKRSKMI